MPTIATPPAGRFALLDQKAVAWGQSLDAALAEEVSKRGARRLFIVTTRSLAQRAAALAKAHDDLDAVGVEDTIPAHTPMPSVFALAQRLATFRPDLILALGGGSVIDAVKIAGLVQAEGIDSREALIARSMQKGGQPLAVVNPPRYIAAPTTLSGAEFGAIGGSVDPDTQIKFGFAASWFPAETVIFDPALGQATPEGLWLSSGVRAVDHAVEAILSPDANPFIDGCALHALRLLGSSLRATKADPGDLLARQESQFGVWLASQSVGRVRYGASHGIGHQLGAVGGVAHGHTSCVMLPSVIAWNAGHVGGRDRLVHEAVNADAPDAATAVAQLIGDLGQPRRLADVGVREDQFERIAELAMSNPFVKANPRPITSPADVVAILQLAA
ncbi:MAG: iron-containing alcohol dehydrogenase [Phreatobacter sp.]|nr:iron-containing alcohol dehydrogenase [Phreatobacter sp.]